ncbi:MAG: dTMP kinase [Candidatus Pacebacteria bacterium]|nr:dTMP kinase [Candidatus Paceibacterota bacterium]
MKNKFVAFEGIDGAGKGTQIAMLAKRLKKEGVRFTLVSAPRYSSPTGQLVRRALFGEFGNFVGLNGYLSAMPYLLDFVAAQPKLEAALKQGTVLSDRYIFSTLAFQGAKVPSRNRAEFLKLIENLLYKEFHLPKPDRVIYFDVPVEQAQKNIRSKRKDQHEKDVAYQKRVANLYHELAKRKEWRVVPCTKGAAMRSPEEIHELVWKALPPMR